MNASRPRSTISAKGLRMNATAPPLIDLDQ
jgi:hypothetical protein